MALTLAIFRSHSKANLSANLRLLAILLLFLSHSKLKSQTQKPKRNSKLLFKILIDFKCCECWVSFKVGLMFQIFNCSVNVGDDTWGGGGEGRMSEEFLEAFNKL
jgi:hypothetical protein